MYFRIRVRQNQTPLESHSFRGGRSQTDKEVDKTKIVNKPSNVQLCVNYPTLAYFTEKVNTDKGGIEVFIYDNENKLLVSSCSLHSELAYYMIQDKKY